jgi:hypothetical protein
VSASDNAGFLAFVAFAVLAVALWFLMRNMNARMRRMSYRQRAAHRGRDDPQATQEDLRDEADGDDLPGAEDPDEPSSS